MTEPEPMNEEDFIGKVAWEGGIVGALEYGLTASDLQDPDSQLAKAWRRMEGAWAKFENRRDRVQDLIPDEAW